MAYNIGHGNGPLEPEQLPDPIKTITTIDLYGGNMGDLAALLAGGVFLDAAAKDPALNPTAKQFESTLNLVNEPYVALYDGAGEVLGYYVVEGSYETAAGSGVFVTTLGDRFYPIAEIIECMELIQAATAATVAPLYTLDDNVTPINFADFFVLEAEFDLKNSYGTIRVYDKVLGQFVTRDLDARQTAKYLANGWAGVDAGGGRKSTPCGGKLFKGISLGECDGGPVLLKWCEIQEPIEAIDPCMVVTGLKAEDDVYSGDVGIPIVLDLVGNDSAGSLGIDTLGIYDADASAVAGEDVFATAGNVNIYANDGTTVLGVIDAANPTVFTAQVGGAGVFEYQITDRAGNKSKADVSVNFRVPEIIATVLKNEVSGDSNDVYFGVTVDGGIPPAGTVLTYVINGITIVTSPATAAADVIAAINAVGPASGITKAGGGALDTTNVTYVAGYLTLSSISRNDPAAHGGFRDNTLDVPYEMTVTAEYLGGTDTATDTLKVYEYTEAIIPNATIRTGWEPTYLNSEFNAGASHPYLIRGAFWFESTNTAFPLTRNDSVDAFGVLDVVGTYSTTSQELTVQKSITQKEYLADGQTFLSFSTRIWFSSMADGDNFSDNTGIYSVAPQETPLVSMNYLNNSIPAKTLDLVGFTPVSEENSVLFDYVMPELTTTVIPSNTLSNVTFASKTVLATSGTNVSFAQTTPTLPLLPVSQGVIRTHALYFQRVWNRGGVDYTQQAVAPILRYYR